MLDRGRGIAGIHCCVVAETLALGFPRRPIILNCGHYRECCAGSTDQHFDFDRKCVRRCRRYSTTIAGSVIFLACSATSLLLLSARLRASSAVSLAGTH